MNEVDVEAFIKFGQETHMRNLFDKGEVFMNTIDYFKYHKNPQIGDKYENLKNIWQVRKLDLKPSYNKTNEISVSDTYEQLLEHSNKKGNLFCLFSVKTSDFIPNEDNNTYELDLGIYKDFGDYACIIYKPSIFANLICKELTNKGFDPKRKLVYYYDPEEHHGSLNIFCKRMKYSHQKEARVHVNTEINESIKIEIGSLEKIALLKSGLNGKIRIDSTEFHLNFSQHES